MPRSRQDYYIIEHPTRGTVRESELEDNPNHSGGGLKPRFSITGMRSDADKAKQYAHLYDAIGDVTAVAAANEKLANQLKIRRSSDWKYLCDSCGNWCEMWNDHKRDCHIYMDEVKRHGY